jgi:transcriptional regulator with XRE-family HTH domain
MKVGEYIKEKRIKAKYTVQELHRLSGVAASTICRIEAGNVPHLESLEAIAKVLGIKPSTILKACGK